MQGCGAPAGRAGAVFTALALGVVQRMFNAIRINTNYFFAFYLL
jgi:hypothetical protein